MELAYILPFVVYLCGAAVAGMAPGIYPQIYLFVVLGTFVSLLWSLRRVDVIRPHWKVLDAIAIGIAGIIAWILLDRLQLEESFSAWLPAMLQPQPRTAFDPFTELSPVFAWLFVGVRIAGLALIVPIVEELFWRGFLARWFVSENWTQVAIGRFTPLAFGGVTLLFTAAHPEWIAAAVYCVMLNLLLMWRKDLWCCVVAHAVSNLILGLYIVWTENYFLW